MPKAKTRFVEYEATASTYTVPLDVIPAGSGGGASGDVVYTWVSGATVVGAPVPVGPKYYVGGGKTLRVDSGAEWTAPFPCTVVISERGLWYTRDGVTWRSAFVESALPSQEPRTRPGLDDRDNPLLRAAKVRLAEIEANERAAPAKSGPPQLIFDEQPDGYRVPPTVHGWAEEIKHEIAEVEKAWDDAYRDAHGENLERHPALMVAACEEALASQDFRRSIRAIADLYLPGFESRGSWMYGLMLFFALDCLVPVDDEDMRAELRRESLPTLLRLAKAVNWGQPVDSKDWTG